MRHTLTHARFVLVAVFAIALVFSSAATAVASDWYVDSFLGDDLLGDGSVVNPYASIETALTTATAGDDIYVASGLYSENATLTSGVDIWGAGAASTFVSSAGGDHIFTASSVESVTVDGLSIIGGYGPFGAGMLSDNATMTISSCAFSSNEATQVAAGGLTIIDSRVNVTDCEFANNIGLDGGALASWDSTVTITGSTFTDNEALRPYGTGAMDVGGGGGGAYCVRSAGTISGSTFTGNSSQDDGGAIALHLGNDVDILANTFTGNSAVDGGAIGVYIDSVINRGYWIASNTFTGNSADQDGGAVNFTLVDASDDNSATVTMNTITGNTADENGGGLSYYLDDSFGFISDVTSNTISNNSAGAGGGGIAHTEIDNVDGITTIANNTIASNSGLEGAGIGAAFIDSADLELDVLDNAITDNTAAGDAGGIGVLAEGSAELRVEMNGNTIADNSAVDGGGGGVMVYYDNAVVDSNVSSYDNVVEGNSAKYDGGGIYYYSGWNCDRNYVDLIESTIASNVAGSSGAGVWATNFDGSDEYLGVYVSTITANVAGDDGAGVYMYDMWSEIDGNTITSNTTPERGGGIFFEESSVGIFENTISENSSGRFGGGLGVVDSEFGAFENDFVDNVSGNFGGGLGANFTDGLVAANRFSGNTATNGGGAAHQGNWVDFYSNIFESNIATDTGGGLFLAGSPDVINNTFVDNNAFFVGDGIDCAFGAPIVGNNIFWGHGDDHSGPILSEYSITTEFGPTNFFADPMFRDEAAGDYRLQPGSPAIDTATSTVGPSSAPPWDFDNEARPQDGDGNLVALWDIGAFEMPEQRAPEANGDTYTIEEDGLLVEPIPGVLANDTDDNGDSLTAIVTTMTANGIVTLSPNGSFAYWPDADWFGTDTFNYMASDGTSLSAPATVTITVTPVNDAPVASADTTMCAEDTSATIDVLANDSDPVEGDSITASLTAGPANGAVALDASGTAVYTPNADWFGTDMFWYVAHDGSDYSDPATVTITVTSINDAPVASMDTTMCAEDTSATINVLDNDSDTEGDSLTASLTVGPANGGVALDASGTAVYTPNADWFGTDMFWYVASDGSTDSAPATVTVTVTPVNDPPVASDDTTSCAEDTFATTNVLTNDDDPVEGDPLTAELATGATNGSVMLAPSGEVTYTPDANWFGTDTFTYRAHDGTDYSNPATVTITVTSVNDPPVASADTTMCAEDTSATVDVLANDSDPIEGDSLTASLTVGPANGMLVLPPNGMAVYTPNADWFGTDSFWYRAYDGMDFSDPVEVMIEVTPVNDPPVSVEDTYTVDEDGTLIVPAFGVLENDSDIEDDPLSTKLVSDVSSGTLIFSSEGAFTYTPAADFYGIDMFLYRSYDGDLYSGDTTVSITVNPVNDAPESTDDTATCAEDTVATLNVLTNDTDADPMDVLEAIVWTDPSNGTIELAPSGEATYTPDADWFGEDTFTYRVYDGMAYSGTALVTIEVTSVNDTPTPMPDAYDTTESTTLTVDAPGVLGNDTDVEMDSLTTTLTSDASSGMFMLATDGSFEYVPDDGFWGVDEFAYAADDGDLVSTPVTVTITVDDVTPPMTTSDALLDYDAFALITLEATDTASGVAMTYYSLNGEAAVATTTVFTDVLGDHELTFWSVDVAGNIEDPTTVEFHIGALTTTYETIAGADRYATAVAASQRAFPTTASTVVIATGENWPDALGGSALAGVSDGPVLLSRTDGLPGSVGTEIARLGATEAYVLGGTAALDDAVVTDLQGLGLTVTRLGGSNRYATARLVASEVVGLQGPAYDGMAFVSTGMEFADALAAGPIAAKMYWPVYLTQPDEIANTTLKHMVDRDVEKVVILGGKSAVSSDVETRLDQTFGGSDVSRLAGSNRYTTAIEVAEWSVKKSPLIWDGVAFATGENFPDSLAAGPMQAKLGSVLLLTGTDQLPTEVRTHLIGLRDDVDEARFLGGTVAISPQARVTISDALR